jgi:hypothetical protein
LVETLNLAVQIVDLELDAVPAAPLVTARTRPREVDTASLS